MTDEEFDVLDELYFVVSFDQLKNQVEIHEDRLLEILCDFYRKGWAKILKTVDDEVSSLPDLPALRTCHFLATKKGLQAHNS